MSHSVAKVKKYGADYTGGRPIEDRRWAVKVFPRGAAVQYIQAIQLPLPKLPVHGWVKPSVRTLDELTKYFQLTEKFEATLLFADPNDALHEAFKIEEFGIEADILEVERFAKETEPATSSRG